MLVVVVSLPNGGARTRVFRTVRAADNAVANAQERGMAAAVMLARLMPVSATFADLRALLDQGGEQ